MKTFNRLWKTYIFDPLAGGNGKIQTSEYAQWALIAILVLASRREGMNPGQDLPDTFWIMIPSAVAAIAGFKIVFPKKNDTQNPEA